MGKFEPKDELEGYDEWYTFPRQLIPLNEEREVKLANGWSYDVHNWPFGVASFEDVGGRSTTRLFKLRGLKEGDGKLHAVHTRTGEILELVYKVVPKRAVKAYFHLVMDEAGHSTGRSPVGLEGLVRKVNKIIEPQTNVRLTFAGWHPEMHPKDLGDKICSINEGDPSLETARRHYDYYNKFKGYRIPGMFNVFMVWEVAFEWKECRSTEPNHTAGVARWGRMALMEDPKSKRSRFAFRDDLILAHEFGHFLGLNHHYSTQMLMFAKPNRTRITWDDALQMNKDAEKYGSKKK